MFDVVADMRNGVRIILEPSFESSAVNILTGDLELNYDNNGWHDVGLIFHPTGDIFALEVLPSDADYGWSSSATKLQLRQKDTPSNEMTWTKQQDPDLSGLSGTVQVYGNMNFANGWEISCMVIPDEILDLGYTPDDLSVIPVHAVSLEERTSINFYGYFCNGADGDMFMINYTTGFANSTLKFVDRNNPSNKTNEYEISSIGSELPVCP